MAALFSTRIFRRMFFSLLLVMSIFLIGIVLTVVLRTRAALIERQYEVSAIYREQVAGHIIDWMEERRSDVTVLARTLEIESEFGAEANLCGAGKLHLYRRGHRLAACPSKSLQIGHYEIYQRPLC